MAYLCCINLFSFPFPSCDREKPSLSFLLGRKLKSTALRGVWVCVLVIILCVFRFTAIFPVCFTEPLEVHNLPRPQELDRFVHVGLIPYETKDIVIGGACLLLRCHILHQIRNDIAFGLELAGIEGNAARRLRPDADSVIHVIIAEAALLDLLHGKVLCELVHNGGYHLKMCQFLSTDVGIEIAHLDNSVKWAHHHNIIVS